MLIKVEIKRVITTPNACAVLLGDGEKTFLLYVGAGVGMAIAMSMEGFKKPRPLTHDLLSSILAGLNVSVERVVINDLRGGTFYARLFLKEETDGQKRIVEIDARPSDCLVVASLKDSPIYVEKSVMDQLEDMSHLLEGGAEDDKAG